MKMILDLDTGIDDALALAYALGRPEVELIGVLGSFGNVTVDTSVRNSLDLLALLGSGDVPVCRGAAHAWGAKGYEPGPFKYRIHGKNGIGNVILPRSAAEISPVGGVDFLLDAARRFGPELAVVATGPLTNLAQAIRQDRTAMERVGRISIMGGALTVPGNRTPFAEANICDDTAAANYVMESGIPLTMVGLDVTLKTKITGREIDDWRGVNTPAAKALVKMSEYYYTNESETGEIGGAIHDPLAVEAAICPDAFEMLPCNLTVITEGPGAGRTVGDPARLSCPEKSVQVCVDVAADAFVEKFARTIHQLLCKG